jgi:hypothetical protein
MGKRVVMASAGWYNFTWQHKLNGEKVYVAGEAPKKLLALHPAVDLSHVTSLSELRAIMTGLLQVRRGEVRGSYHAPSRNVSS